MHGGILVVRMFGLPSDYYGLSLDIVVGIYISRDLHYIIAGMIQL